MKKPKVIIYDNDGMITDGERFSIQYVKEHDVSIEDVNVFFDNYFRDCLHGKKDLKEEIQPFLKKWKWKGTADAFLEYWFRFGIELHQDVYDSVTKLRSQGLIVCLATNQEKYRTEFLIEKFSYDKLFDEIFSSSSLGCFKTVPEGLNKIYETLNKKYGEIDRSEIMYWDDRVGNVKQVTDEGFNGQQFTDYESFREVLDNVGYRL